MLHRVMIKATPLHDVAGRVDYISNPDRQEHLVYADENCADTEFWKRLSEHCQAMAPGKKACEGREFILPLPNWMYEETLTDRVWVCPSCGETILRDKNAAINIRNAGVAQIA